jgi:putative ABC transport system permease protein
MKFLDILKSANSNLLRNKARSFLTILAIFIGSFTIILTTGINTGVNNYIDRQVESAGGEGYLEIMPAATASMVMEMTGGGGLGEPTEYNPNSGAAGVQTITKEDIEKIRAIPGIESARGHSQASAEYITSGQTDRKFNVRINELPSERIHIDMAAGRMVSLSTDVPEIALTPGYAEVLGFESDEAAVGQTVRLGIASYITQQITEVEAVISGVQQKTVVSMGRSAVNSALFDKINDVVMAGMPAEARNQVYYVTAEFDPDLSDEEVQAIKDQLEEIGFVGLTVGDQVGMVKNFFDAITTILTIFGVIALLAASIGIVNTLLMAVQERTREIGLMKAMGLGAGKIFLMFSFEAIALGFWGSVLGIAIANIARLIANNLANETFLKQLPGFTLIEFDPANLAVIVLIVMAIAFFAGSLPARRAAKKDPIDALRYE